MKLTLADSTSFTGKAFGAQRDVQGEVEVSGPRFGLVTPRHFRRHRLSQLDRADAMIVVRTELSESSAFEVAYNVFRERTAPIFFAVWRQAPIKTTLLQELDELTTVRYVDFDHPRELHGPLLEFFQRLAPRPESLLTNGLNQRLIEV